MFADRRSYGWLSTILALGLAVNGYALEKDKADPLAGRWELNLAKTHYGGGAEPRKQETFTCLTKKEVASCAIKGTRQDGSKVEGGFTAAYDGTAGPVRGIPDVDEVRLERVSGTVATATFSFQGSLVFAYRATRSPDGRMLTVVSIDPVTRRRLKSVVVYDAVEKK